MSTFELILLAVALAMDCFTMSLVSGVIVRRFHWGLILRMGILFGVFQAMMPFLGWLGVNFFSSQLETIGHWIAFALLVFIGGRMIKESFEEEPQFNPFALQTLLLLSVATSIDALAVGVSFACIGYTKLGMLVMPLFVIGIASLLFSVLGNVLGVKFGNGITKRVKPEFFGGIVLILIGIRILLTHII